MWKFLEPIWAVRDNKLCFGESETRNGYGIRSYQEEPTFGEWAAHEQPTVLFMGLFKIVSGLYE